MALSLATGWKDWNLHKLYIVYNTKKVEIEQEQYELFYNSVYSTKKVKYKVNTPTNTIGSSVRVWGLVGSTRRSHSSLHHVFSQRDVKLGDPTYLCPCSLVLAQPVMTVCFVLIVIRDVESKWRLTRSITEAKQSCGSLSDAGIVWQCCVANLGMVVWPHDAPLMTGYFGACKACCGPRYVPIWSGLWSGGMVATLV